jgi:hypothetical protein
MEYDIVKFVFPGIGLLAGFFTAFSNSRLALKLKSTSSLIFSGCLVVFFAVVSHSMLQGHFDPTTLIDFLILKKIGISGPSQILAFGYLLLFWGLPILVFRKTPVPAAQRPSIAPILIIKSIRYGFPLLWTILFVYLGYVSHDIGGEEGLFYAIVYMALTFPSSYILVGIINSIDHLAPSTDIVSSDVQHLLYTLLFMIVGFVQWYGIIWLLTSDILKRKGKPTKTKP